MNRRTTISICLTVVVSGGAAMLWAEEKPASNTALMRSVVEKTALELWRSNIKPPAGKENSSELAEALRRLKSMRFQKKADLFANAEASSKQPTSRPTSQPSQAKADQPARINPEMLAKLKQLPPGSITEPAALADTLFLGGYLESAAFFYELALKNETDADEKAWLLFQTANCYRETNPTEAVKAYAKLLTEYPNSLWSSAAYMPKNIIEWHKANKLDDLLKELEKQNRKDVGPSAARKKVE
ncbi:MAG: tetratricopeptide repeat protein [Phycisphaerae bacterium]|nr:tetratricopeptide repeat protein [Phycisphaerae bacterium]